MKKRIFIAFLSLAILFAGFSLFAKPVVNTLLFKDTAPNISLQNEKPSLISLKKGDYLVFGEYLDEKILWEVLSVDNKGRPLLMSEHIICFKAFDASSSDFKFGSSDWGTSALKAWLNSSEEEVCYNNEPNSLNIYKGYNSYEKEAGFLNDKNFSQEQRALISSEGVFILSKKEITDLLNTKNRKKTCTKSAVINDDSPYIITSGKNVWYWTSSSISSNKMSVATVTSAGSFYKSLAYDSTAGVAPALYLKSQNVEVLSGDSSRDNPYYLR